MSGYQIPKTPSAYEFPLLIRHLLSRLSTQHAEQQIIYSDERRFSYREFFERVQRLANGLTGLGIGVGDTVAVMDWDSHRYLECFFAVPMLGAVLHTINIRLAPEQILYTINHARDTVLLVHDDFAPILEEFKDEIPTVKRTLRLSDRQYEEADGSNQMEFDDKYESLISRASPQFEAADFDENIRATTFYTTGTTGNPKGVYFSQRQIVLHTLGVAVALSSAAGQGRVHSDDVYMPITPMFHVHAWGIPYIATMLGLKQVYPGRYEPARLLSLIDKEKVTFSHCVPTILHMLLSNPAVENVNLSNWKVIIGGSGLPPALARRARDLGIDVFGGYGMSETAPVLTLAQLNSEPAPGEDPDRLEIRCKAGRPIPLVELKVVDSELNEVPRDGASTGEVVVRAPWLTQGYLEDPERSEDLWAGGVLHTSDIGHVDSAGYLKITDRLKDVIKSGGEWISSLELEDIALTCKGVNEAAAIGIADEQWGERPLLLLVAAEGAASIESVQAEFQRQVKERAINEWAIPKRIEIVSDIPKTSVGKIDKKKLRTQYG
ncbi:MAG TPA: long-chain fatty acid--CoA ligase [Gammaproteobacteria bacterium]|nr:long-chain fatty acid--CoA ligase [Gammaproteobacteria bacterium]